MFLHSLCISLSSESDYSARVFVCVLKTQNALLINSDILVFCLALSDLDIFLSTQFFTPIKIYLSINYLTIFYNL